MTQYETTEPIPEQHVQEAPTTLWGIMLRLGPGLILVGNIVGSGELIATPTLSAKAGYTFLWLILFSCFIKVFFQIEIGRYAISEGRTTLESMNELPGPRLRVNWFLWYWLVMMLASLVQVGAMCGGVAQALRIAAPIFGEEWSDPIWAILTGLSVIVLLWVGRYRMIEALALFFVTVFTLITIYSVVQVQFTDFAITTQDVIDGFSFKLPEDPKLRSGIFMAALMAFGITGVGASELIAYPYWCLEKGYGRFVGKRTDQESWAHRARSWIKVMQYDAWLSMAVFTVATLAFYLLGAALLHPTGKTPESTEMVQTLSGMYSESFGASAKYIFLIGAFCVLYSTFFIATAANARMLADWCGIAGLFDRNDPEKRRLATSIFCVAFPIFSTAAYLWLEKPVLMVMVSGVVQALMLPLIGFGVMYFAYLRTDVRVRAGKIWYATLWISFALTTVAACAMAYKAIADRI